MRITFQGLRTCIYRVGNIQEATHWYSKALGIKPYFEESFYVGFNVGGYELGLQPEESSEAKGPSVLTYWAVADVAQAYDQLISAGAIPFEEPNEVGGGIVVAAVKDPWGNIVGVIYNPVFNISQNI